MKSSSRLFSSDAQIESSQAAELQSGIDECVTAAKELLRLHTALNAIDDGIILLDRDLRLEFINRAAREFSGTAEMPHPGPKTHFADMIRGARVAAGEAELDAFIAQRLEAVSAAHPAPVDVRFANGKIARARCIALADGGRLLTYTDITDIVRRNEELEQLHTALDQVEYGVILLEENLRARFINRAFRMMASLPDAAAAENPTFEQILNHGRTQNAFALSGSEIDAYIAQRLEQVRLGSAEPIDLRWADGRVIRHQITALHGGSRLLTYTDISNLARTTE